MKKTWVSAYLSLAPDDEIVQTFAEMGKNVNQDLEHCYKLACLKGTTHYKGLYAEFIQLRVT